MIKCDECKFWDKESASKNNLGFLFSDCRRHAPVYNVTGDQVEGLVYGTDWPRTQPTDWCGDAEKRE